MFEEMLEEVQAAQAREIEAMFEELEEAYAHAGEIEAQYHSEVAMFGDAWPGAQAQLDSVKAFIREREIDLGIGRLSPVVAPELPVDDDDIPF